ncbi:MAG: SGNH/GDSL hydrolase family protein [Bacteroidota bacterium]|nr:SGNH/GDSL hydrolase family protein [Bacteroidota bacterium]
MKFYKMVFLSGLLLFGTAVSAQDWPNLGRFQSENAKLGKPAKGEKRVVFIGNSITEQWIGADPAFFSGHGYINRGIGGQTTPQMLVRFRQDVISLEPKVVVILGGTNDIAGNTGPSTLEMIEDNLASMAELANSNHIRVILSSVMPVYDYPWKPGLQPAEKIVRLNSWIKSYCKKKHFIYLDYFSALADERNGMKASLTVDGVHANMAGYKVMEPLVESAIHKALK